MSIVRLTTSPCPLNVLVGENSPKVCPTISSLTKTSIKIFPAGFFWKAGQASDNSPKPPAKWSVSPPLLSEIVRINFPSLLIPKSRLPEIPASRYGAFAISDSHSNKSGGSAPLPKGFSF